MAFRGKHVQFFFTLFYLQDIPSSCSSWKKMMATKAEKPYTGNNSSGGAAEKKKKKVWVPAEKVPFLYEY